MKRLILAAAFAMGLVAAVEAQEQTVSQADLQAIIQRLNKLEAENKAQAARIAELEGKKQVAAAPAAAEKPAAKADEGTKISESGKVYTTESGRKYFLADATANIFEPLSESGLQITPYGYLVFEGVYADHGLSSDWTTDFVQPKNDIKYRNHNSTLSMQDSILGIQFATPESFKGWKFSGKAEFDLAGANIGGGHADDYDLHWRHLYVNAEHAAYDADGKENGSWSILFGQTWHLWKMVSPSEIDGAWMENAGHPYRRSPQLRVTRRWDWEDSSLEARVGFVKNGPNASTDRDADGMLDSSASAWGWFEGAVVYDHQAAWEEDGDRRWLVGLGGMYGRDASRRWDGIRWEGESDDYNSQMLMLAGSVPFTIEEVGEFTLSGQMYFGENLGRVQAGCGQSVSFYNVANRKGEEVMTSGGFVDLAYKLNDTWSFAIGYGFDNPQVEDGTLVNDNNGGVTRDFIDFNDRLYLDAFYKISSNFRLGLEYARLSTKYAQSGDAVANRVQFSAFYDF